MSRTISLPKSTTALSLMVAGALGSLIAIGSSPTSAVRQEPSVLQSFEQSVGANSSLNQSSSGTAGDNGRTGVALALLAGGGAVIAVSAMQNKRGHSPVRARSKGYSQTHSHDVSVDRASNKLRKRLMRLLHDDRATANRLLMQVSFKYPNHPTDWYMEKVIYDLERDRRSF